MSVEMHRKIKWIKTFLKVWHNKCSVRDWDNADTLMWIKKNKVLNFVSSDSFLIKNMMNPASVLPVSRNVKTTKTQRTPSSQTAMLRLLVSCVEKVNQTTDCEMMKPLSDFLLFFSGNSFLFICQHIFSLTAIYCNFSNHSVQAEDSGVHVV